METVSILSRKAAQGTYVPVTLDADAVGMPPSKGRPTYDAIRAWVREERGLNVTKLNVAQAKAAAGLERQADRSGGGRQPACPPEKLEAILAAFRHFGMLGEEDAED